MAELDIRQIFEILPHRYPMLLVDRILEFEPMKRVRGYKNITYNEHSFTGHFPGNPLLPGVYMIEAMAQLGGAVVLEPGEFSRKTPYLAGIDKAKFRRPVDSGRSARHGGDDAAPQAQHRLGSGEATVDGQFACSAELMFSITSDPRIFGSDSSVLRV